MERDCKIVQDLLPNYLEKTTSKETNQYIEEHIKQCPKCSKICNVMKEELNISCSLDIEKEVNYMKKFNGKMKRLELWKKIAMVMISILIILLGIVLYRYSIITKIYKLHSKINEITNVYYQAEFEDKVIEFWRKDNIIKQVNKLKNKEEAVTFWRDISTEEGYLIPNTSKIYAKTPKEVPSQNLPWGFAGDWDTFEKRIKIAINPTITITIKQYDNKDCYYLRLNGSDFFNNTEEIYEKDTGLLLFESGHTQYSSWGEDINCKVKYEYKINVVLDKDVERPNLSEYELRDN